MELDVSDIHCVSFGEPKKYRSKFQSTISFDILAIVICFVFSDSPDAVEEIPSMPNVFRYGINQVQALLEPLVKKGLASVLLFGVVSNLPKDEVGTHADSLQNPVIQILPKIRQWFPDLVIACDVSLLCLMLIYVLKCMY